MTEVGPAQSRSAATRWLYFALGWVFFALGVVGAVLPVMPTTVFMILALWSFSRSSERFHRWLLNHRVFGPGLRRWKAHGVIPLRIKLVAWSSMAASLGLMIWARAPWYALVAAAILIAVGAIYIACRPSRIPDAPSAYTADASADEVTGGSP